MWFSYRIRYMYAYNIINDDNFNSVLLQKPSVYLANATITLAKSNIVHSIIISNT